MLALQHQLCQADKEYHIGIVLSNLHTNTSIR